MSAPIPHVHFFDHEGGLVLFTILGERVEVRGKPTMLDRGDATILVEFLKDFLAHTDIVEAMGNPPQPPANPPKFPPPPVKR